MCECIAEEESRSGIFAKQKNARSERLCEAQYEAIHRKHEAKQEIVESVIANTHW